MRYYWTWRFLDFRLGLFLKRSRVYWHGVWPKHWIYIVRSHHGARNVHRHDVFSGKSQRPREKRSRPLSYNIIDISSSKAFEINVTNKENFNYWSGNIVLILVLILNLTCTLPVSTAHDLHVYYSLTEITEDLITIKMKSNLPWWLVLFSHTQLLCLQPPSSWPLVYLPISVLWLELSTHHRRLFVEPQYKLQNVRMNFAQLRGVN